MEKQQSFFNQTKSAVKGFLLILSTLLIIGFIWDTFLILCHGVWATPSSNIALLQNSLMRPLLLSLWISFILTVIDWPIYKERRREQLLVTRSFVIIAALFLYGAYIMMVNLIIIINQFIIYLKTGTWTSYSAVDLLAVYIPNLPWWYEPTSWIGVNKVLAFLPGSLISFIIAITLFWISGSIAEKEKDRQFYAKQRAQEHDKAA